MCQMSVSALLYIYMMLTLSPKCPFPISVNEITAFETHSNRVEYKFVLVLLKSFSYLMTSRMNKTIKRRNHSKAKKVRLLYSINVYCRRKIFCTIEFLFFSLF